MHCAKVIPANSLIINVIKPTKGNIWHNIYCPVDIDMMRLPSRYGMLRTVQYTFRIPIRKLKSREISLVATTRFNHASILKFCTERPYDLCKIYKRLVNWEISYGQTRYNETWWRHQMETFSVLLALCAGNSSVTGEFFAQKPVTRSFDVFFDLRLNKHLSKQSWGWWLETPYCLLWRHCNEGNSYIVTATWARLNIKTVFPDMGFLI